MSIIIVGVGQADFDAMDELDSDDVRLSSMGRFADRDIVQVTRNDPPPHIHIFTPAAFLGRAWLYGVM